MIKKNDSIGEYVERDSLAVLDDFNGLADSAISFVNFMTTCRKLGIMYLTNINILLTILHSQWTSLLTNEIDTCV